jgi:dinuclear metal center YbgI/SA1388 family protein
VQLAELVAYLDDYLRIAAVGDDADAWNGLQVGSGGEVTRIAAAVDACEAVINEAVRARADLLLVHHGLFWGGAAPVTGRTYRKMAALVRGNLAVYSAHLPLDVHAEVGNNPLLARLLGMQVEGWWGEYKGGAVGVWGSLSVSREELVERTRKALGVDLRLIAGGPARTSRVGVVTGSGGSMIGQAHAAGLDTLVTGEGKHSSFFDAEELGVNVLYAGHYATETLGVRALAEHIEQRHRIPWTFIDHPTGL